MKKWFVLFGFIIVNIIFLYIVFGIWEVIFNLIAWMPIVGYLIWKERSLIPKRILCCFCNRPIHINSFGGVFKNKNNKKESFMCNNLICLISYHDANKENEK